MSSSSKIIIFHLSSDNGQPLLLHPFERNPRLVEELENTEIKGYYGSEPKVESLTLLRNELYKDIEKGLKLWLNEERFIPKFLISSGVFLLIYVSIAWIISPPVSSISELILAFMGSAISFFLLGKRDRSSQSAIKKRISFRNKVDQIHFQESKTLIKIEELLKDLQQGSSRDMDWVQDHLSFLLEWDKTDREAFTEAVELELLHSLKVNRKKLNKLLDTGMTNVSDRTQQSLLLTYQLLMQK